MSIKNLFCQNLSRQEFLIEAGVSQGWEKYLGEFGEAISIEKFGASAPYEIIFKEYGFTKEAIVQKVKSIISKLKD